MTTKPTIYIAGPMRGIPYYNFPAFDKARERLIADEWDVVSPADMDREHGFHASTLPADHDWNTVPDGVTLEGCVARDLEAVQRVDAIYMLDGWHDSKGARAEYSVAAWMGKEVLYESIDAIGESNNGETRITDPNTGGEKGRKLARWELLPGDALHELAEHYGKGCEKYADRNWERGYNWSLSFGAMMRHAWAMWGGEDVDEETGSLHMTAVAWHALALLAYQLRSVGTDDRAILTGGYNRPETTEVTT